MVSFIRKIKKLTLEEMKKQARAIVMLTKKSKEKKHGKK